MNTTKRHLGRAIRRSINPTIARRIAQLDRAWRIDGQREGRLENALAWRLGQLSQYTRQGGPSGYDQGRRIQILNARLLGQSSGWEKYSTDQPDGDRKRGRSLVRSTSCIHPPGVIQ